MPDLTISTPITGDSIGDILRVLTSFKREVEDGVNSNASIISGVSSQGVNSSNQGKAGDIISGFNTSNGNLSVGIKQASNSDKIFTLNANTEAVANAPTLPVYPSDIQYILPTSSNTIISTTDLPQSGNYGWHLNTSTGLYSWGLNAGGVIEYQDISTLTGTITAAQHGNLTIGTLHPFTVISGTITNVQHAAQTDPTLHAVATISAPGFMTAAQVSTLASITTIVSDITSTGSVTELLNCTQLQVNGTKVVGARDTAWTIAGGISASKALTVFTPGGSYTPSDLSLLAEWIAGIVSTLLTHGLLG